MEEGGIPTGGGVGGGDWGQIAAHRLERTVVICWFCFNFESVKGKAYEFLFRGVRRPCVRLSVIKKNENITFFSSAE
jgi:hypothetical protein